MYMIIWNRVSVLQWVPEALGFSTDAPDRGARLLDDIDGALVMEMETCPTRGLLDGALQASR